MLRKGRRRALRNRRTGAEKGPEEGAEKGRREGWKASFTIGAIFLYGLIGRPLIRQTTLDN